jgi:UDP-N-acetylglucosamine 4,6-dehydratase/5-epimerase
VENNYNFTDKTILVTGGTGSFGKTVSQNFLTSDVGEVRIFSRDEKKQDEMRKSLQDSRLKFIIGDIREYTSIREAMSGVDYVFHAAALKQVPSCEFYPMEAVRTNILGAENILMAAKQEQVKRVVVLSTDKAVYPINAMGMSKALMEKLMVAKSRITANNNTVFCATRYGNVMASRGSVIPLFIDLIKSGKPLTITDPNMTRFMMSLTDSVDLVLHAFENASPGDIFIQKAPACTVETLANALKEIFSANNPIKIIGTRHGEKLHETLMSREERFVATESRRHFRIPADPRDLNYDNYFHSGSEEVSKCSDYNSSNTEQLDVKQTVKLMLTLPYVVESLK